MSSNTIEVPNTIRKEPINIVIAPKDPDMVFKLQFILFVALERLISYFSFIYSVI
ncbi:MAG: hypothetical protein K9W44_17660 [Candidatus Lokiarchaeota archaeon]|nr:hypothetical protein [Candidatus Harpocratesius repetitus]